MPEQSNIFQCIPTDDDSDDGRAESKFETNSTASSSLIDHNNNSINYDVRKSSRSTNKRRNRNNINSNSIRHYTVKLAAIGQRGMQAGCHSAAATVDDTFCKSVDNVFESAVDLLMPNINYITGDAERNSKEAANADQDDHTVEVDYNGSLHTIVSNSSTLGTHDEIIMVPKEKGSKQQAKRVGIMGRLFRPKREAPVDNSTTAIASQRAPKPVSRSPAPTRQRAVTTVSLLDESEQQNTSRRDFNNDAVVLRSFGDKPQHLQPQNPNQQRQARALKTKSVNQTAGATNQQVKESLSSSSSSWWGKNKKKELSKKQSALETQRYVHQQEEAIQEGNTSVLMIRMHRTPTNCMVPQTR
jgi:hypothetical protein